MIVHLSAGGSRLRVQLANAQGNASVAIGEARIAGSAGGLATLPGTDRALSFGGRPGVVIPPGAIVLSDPVDLPVAAASDLAVSLYVPGRVGALTTHPLGLHSTYILKGNVAAVRNPQAVSENLSYFWLADVDVWTGTHSDAIAAFGDSITDGFATTPNRNRAWPDVLYERLRALNPASRYSVINLGLSGNRVLNDGAGASALARFDRDVLARPGVRWVVLLEGINDISFPNVPGTPAAQRISAEDLISGYRLLIEQAHLHGIRILGGTILPWEGVWTYSASAERIRIAVNDWIRSSGAFDAVIDFDAATRDPSHPSRLLARFDSGDHVHPNDAGNRAMADTIDLKAFELAGIP
jgi:lysophospholipase L1-like esterase